MRSVSPTSNMMCVQFLTVAAPNTLMSVAHQHGAAPLDYLSITPLQHGTE
ncbi:hypothetical protein FEP39_05455 [Burkholderia multivorans]|nr:hypothetical protein [Burkholderia multivorans]MDR9060150.1 hypothetical protein [Burkholderia multivorans]MDR9062455.1 hypothetical protein [Burkholderia multivorans]MDR9072197.1 hypothetical protein [Burkholderia multivorans]MDR9076522.1 hypothetical protein [Burkholderia multivorans]